MNKFFISILFFVFISCNRDVYDKDSSIIQFDVTKEYSSKELDISSIANVEYVLPVSKDSFLFTNFVYLTDNHIVMFNYFEGDFVFFDRKGNPGSIISKMGQGPDEYLPYYWLQIYCEKEDELFVFSVPDVLKVYDRSGNYKRTLHLRNKKDVSCSINAFYNYNDDYLLCHDKLSERKPFYLLNKKDGETKDIDIIIEKQFDGEIRKDYGDGNTMNVFMNCSYAIKEGDNMLLTEYGTDTIFAYTPDFQLIPKFVRIPSIHEMDPPIVVHGFLEAGNNLFFSTQKKEYNFNTRKGMEHRGYMYDKSTNTFYEIKVYNKDYEGQDLIITPAEMTTRIGECSSNPHTGIRVLWKNDLVKANEAGKLHGDLKHLFDRMGDEDPFILMILEFIQN